MVIGFYDTCLIVDNVNFEYLIMKTKKYFFGALLIACIPFTANAQFMMFGGGNRVNQDSLRKIAEADYADMLAKVGVGQPREGR